MVCMPTAVHMVREIHPGDGAQLLQASVAAAKISYQFSRKILHPASSSQRYDGMIDNQLFFPCNHCFCNASVTSGICCCHVAMTTSSRGMLHLRDVASLISLALSMPPILFPRFSDDRISAAPRCVAVSFSNCLLLNLRRLRSLNHGDGRHRRQRRSRQSGFKSQIFTPSRQGRVRSRQYVASNDTLKKVITLRYSALFLQISKI